MTDDELVQQVRYEIGRIEQIALELQELERDVGSGPVALREKAAAGALLASFYMGVENVLKRVLRYYGMEVPQSERWHVELFEQFCDPPEEPLPVFFDDELVVQMDAYRRFRHVVHHGYEFDLDWNRMQEGLREAVPVFSRFREHVEDYLEQLGG